jgi:pimeloyl-ACP methyl ester carboxylesterase
VHTGFNESAEALRERVNAATTGSTRVDYVGHSAGGAIAMIFAARAPETQTTNVITFGAPRVGDRRFEDLVRERTGGNIARIVNNRDGVPGTGLGAHGTRPIITDGTNLSVGDRPDAPGAFVQTLVNFATNRMLAVGHHRIGSGYGSLGPNPPDGPPAITPHEPPLTGGSRLNGLQRLAASCSKFCHDRAATCRFGWSQNLFQSIAVGIERLAGLSPSAGGSNPPGNNVERGG